MSWPQRSWTSRKKMQPFQCKSLLESRTFLYTSLQPQNLHAWNIDLHLADKLQKYVYKHIVLTQSGYNLETKPLPGPTSPKHKTPLMHVTSNGHGWWWHNGVLGQIIYYIDDIWTNTTLPCLVQVNKPWKGRTHFMMWWFGLNIIYYIYKKVPSGDKATSFCESFETK